MSVFVGHLRSESSRAAKILHSSDSWNGLHGRAEPCPAPDVGDDRKLTEVSSRLSQFCWTWPAARTPALSVPCGFSEGLPVGMQIAAGRWRDGLVLNLGHAFQQATDWHRMTPDL